MLAYTLQKCVTSVFAMTLKLVFEKQIIDRSMAIRKKYIQIKVRYFAHTKMDNFLYLLMKTYSKFYNYEKQSLVIGIHKFRRTEEV